MASPITIRQLEKIKDPTRFANRLIKNPKEISRLVEIMTTEEGTFKYGCEKILRAVSEKKPELIYPHFDAYVKLLDSENSFLKWGAIITISNLVVVDSKDKFKEIFRKYYDPISGPVMVTAANIIGGSAKIVEAKPELEPRITREILKVETAKYKHKGKISPECKRVVSGAAIDIFDKYFERAKDQRKIMDFVRKQYKCSRASVAKKAQKFIEKHSN